MSIVSTEIQWEYEPEDFFESPFKRTTATYEIEADKGLVKLLFFRPEEREEVALRVSQDVDDIFRGRVVQTGRSFQLKTPKLVQTKDDGTKANYVSITGTARIVARDQPDFVAYDLDGNIVKDTKQERIARDTAQLEALATKLLVSKTLKSMVDSYNKAVTDPANELIHLYEIRDAAVKEFGNEPSARSSLGISKSKWSRLGTVANDLPLKQGRHRGKKFDALRDATPGELNEARSIAREILEAFIDFLP